MMEIRDEFGEYIRMSNCPEIQGGHYLKFGDVVACKHMTSNNYAHGIHGIDILAGRGTLSSILIWLPRQDDLQKMVDTNCWTVINLFLKYINNLQYPLGLTSMEQIWLAFYMHEVHGKTWDGDKWI